MGERAVERSCQFESELASQPAQQCITCKESTGVGPTHCKVKAEKERMKSAERNTAFLQLYILIKQPFLGANESKCLLFVTSSIENIHQGIYSGFAFYSGIGLSSASPLYNKLIPLITNNPLLCAP